MDMDSRSDVDVKVDAKKFPFTYSRLPLIRYFSKRFEKSLSDLLQESYILEWYLQKRRFRSQVKRVNYFKKALYNRLRRAVNRSGFVVGKALVQPLEEANIQFIKLRAFNDIFYEDLIIHIATLLSRQSSLASNMFLDWNRLQNCWKSVQVLPRYQRISHRKFYKEVKRIKNFVRQEVPRCAQEFRRVACVLD